MDVLSEVLKAVKLDGAVFFNGEFSTPWCTREPDACTMARCLAVQSKHVIIFHLVTEGSGYVKLEGGASRLPLATLSCFRTARRTCSETARLLRRWTARRICLESFPKACAAIDSVKAENSQNSFAAI
jgi:hypothetical protein